MQIHAKTTLTILQHEPENLKHEIHPNNATHHKQETSILVTTAVVQVNLITSEQRPEDFSFEIIGMGLNK